MDELHRFNHKQQRNALAVPSAQSLHEPRDRAFCAGSKVDETSRLTFITEEPREQD
jgi:hypothetical protein